MKKRKNLFIIGAVLILVGLSAVLYLNHYVKKQLRVGLEKEFPSSVLSYEYISVNVLGGNASITNLLLVQAELTVSASKINIKNFSYTTYLRKGNIEIGQLELIGPDIIINKSDTVADAKNSGVEDAQRNVLLKKFTVKGGSLRVVENDTTDNLLYISINNIELKQVQFGKKYKNSLLPFNHSSQVIQSDSIFYDLNTWNSITIKNLKYKKDLELTSFKLIPKFSQEQFDQNIPFEQDWIALSVDHIIFKEFLWDKRNDSLVFKSPLTILDQADIQLYRSKLLEEDTRLKPMYSEMMRNLGVKIQLDSIGVKNSKIVYEEKVMDSRPPAELSFKNVNAGIKNLTNIRPDTGGFPLTSITADALFMGNSRLTLRWEFDFSNPIDEFHISGRLAAIDAQAMNPFLKHAMNMETEGRIESLAYNFYGNRHEATGDMQMSYRDFKVHILKDGEEKKKSFLSRLANLIIKNDVVNEDVTQEKINTQRDKTKSFWNFLWLCIRDGALKIFF